MRVFVCVSVCVCVDEKKRKKIKCTIYLQYRVEASAFEERGSLALKRFTKRYFSFPLLKMFLAACAKNAVFCLFFCFAEKSLRTKH